MRLAALCLLVLMLSGCGTTIKPTTCIYIIGDYNKIGETIRTDNRPDVTTSTEATVPVSALP